MAQSRRVERVAALIRNEMGQMLLNGIQDVSFNSAMITITDVEVSGDLQHCKIYVSIFGNETEIQDVFTDLEQSQIYLKGEMGRRLQMRRAPEVIFKLDKGMKKGNNVLNLLNKLEEERKTKDHKTIELAD